MKEGGKEGGEEGDLCQAKVFPGVSFCHSHYLSWSLPLLTSTRVTAFLGYCQWIKARIQALQRQQGVSSPGVSALEDPRLNLVPVGGSVCTALSHIFAWGLALNSHHSWGSLLPRVCSESTFSPHSPLLGHTWEMPLPPEREKMMAGIGTFCCPSYTQTLALLPSYCRNRELCTEKAGRQAARDEQLTSAFSDTGKVP